MTTDDAVWNEIADVPESDDTPPAMTGAEVAESPKFRAVAAMANLAAENARLRQERNEAREQLAALRKLDIGMLSRALESAEQERDAERERYTRLVGKVERIADRLRADQSLSSVWLIRNEYAALLRSALAAPAPQTAPAQPAAMCQYTDRDLTTGRRLRCEQPAHDGRMHRLVYADAPSEAQPDVWADEDRCTATTIQNGTTLRCEHKADHGGWHDADLQPPPGRVGWAPEDQLPPWAHPAGDEHLQALRAVLINEGHYPLQGDEIGYVRRLIDSYRADLRREREAGVTRAANLSRHLDKARREAERLRGEVAKLETFASEVVTELNPLPLGTYRAALICLRSVRDQLHALAGSSDTTGSADG